MGRQLKQADIFWMMVVGLAAWLIPGAGHFLVKQKDRAIIICIAVILTFAAGLYIGSIGVIDPVGQKLAYAGQILTSPLVAILGYVTAGGLYPVYGKPHEIGQIYTSTAGLLNLLCVVNAVYLAHKKTVNAGV